MKTNHQSNTAANTELEETLGQGRDVPQPAGRLIWGQHRFLDDFIKNKHTHTRGRTSLHTHMVREQLGYKVRREKYSLKSILGRSICFRGVTYVDHISDRANLFF